MDGFVLLNISNSTILHIRSKINLREFDREQIATKVIGK